MNYLKLAQKGFAIAAGVPEDKVIAEDHPSEKGTYRCTADLGEVAFEGTFTPSDAGDHGMVCICVERDGCHWSFPFSLHYQRNILSNNMLVSSY